MSSHLISVYYPHVKNLLNTMVDTVVLSIVNNTNNKNETTT